MFRTWIYSTFNERRMIAQRDHPLTGPDIYLQVERGTTWSEALK